MINFSKLNLESFDSESLGKAIRKRSIKRYRSLDLEPFYSFISVKGKYFRGTETDKYLRIARIRFPFERAFPSFIFRFNKANYRDCKIRPSASTGFAYLVMVALFVYQIQRGLGNFEITKDGLIIIGACFLHVILSIVEFYKSKSRVLQTLTEGHPKSTNTHSI